MSATPLMSLGALGLAFAERGELCEAFSAVFLPGDAKTTPGGTATDLAPTLDGEPCLMGV